MTQSGLLGWDIPMHMPNQETELAMSRPLWTLRIAREDEFYQTAPSQAQRILIVDNHDDFGSRQAKRISSPGHIYRFRRHDGNRYTRSAQPLRQGAHQGLGVEVERGAEFHKPEIEETQSRWFD